jgi:uncharacterized membrane protein
MTQRSGNSPQCCSNSKMAFKGLLISAGALIAYGLSRRSKAGTAIAATGGMLGFLALKPSTQPPQYTARANFLVNASVEDAYRLWRDFENLPRFMSHLQTVRVLDNQRSQWVANGPMNSSVHWEAEITEDRGNEAISWRSLPGSEIDNSGTVTFEPGPQDRGTMVSAEISYSLPLGPVALGFITSLGQNPEFILREDLRRFKALVEAGESPTTVGQTHGPRGLHGDIEQVLFRETSNHPQPQAARGQEA